MANMIYNSRYTIDYKDGKFTVRTEGFMSNWIDIYDLVIFFHEAFNPELYQEIAKRERGIVTKIGKRQIGIFHGMSDNFASFLSTYMDEDEENKMELRSGVDSDDLLIDYMNGDRREFIASVRNIGLLKTIQKWISKYADYPIAGYVMDENWSKYMKRVGQ